MAILLTTYKGKYVDNIKTEVRPGLRLARILVFILLVFASISASALTRTSTAAGGDWSLGSTWVGGVAPLATDDVIIATTSGNSVTLSVNSTCVGVAISNGAILNSGALTLTVNGPWVNNGTFNDGTGTVSFGSASAAINAGDGSANFENMIILSAATLTINTPVNINGDLTFNAPATSQNGIITIASTNTLAVTGQLIMNIPVSNSRSTTINVNDGTLTVNGLTDMKATTGSKRNTIAITSGTVNLNGGYNTGTTAPTIAAACLLTFSGSGTLNIGGTISGGAPALTQSTGTVNFTGSGSQGIWLETYYNLGASNGTKNTLGAVTVSNNFIVTSSDVTTGGNLTAFNLTLNSGSFTLGGTLTSAGALNIVDGTFNGQTFAITLSGSGSPFTVGVGGTFNQGSGLLTMSGASETTIPGTTFNRLTVTNGNKTVQSGTTVTINGEWNQNTSVVLDGTANVYVGGAFKGYGALTMGSGTLSLDSSYASSGAFTPGEGTVKYLGDGGAVKVNWTYYNLEFDGSRSAAGAVTVNNVLTVNSSKTLTLAGSPMNLVGNGNPIVNNGTITSTGNGALVFAGTGTQVIAAGAYPRTTLTNGAKTISSGSIVNITGAFAITAPLTIETNSSVTITGAVTMSFPLVIENLSTLTINGTFAANAQVTYNGNASGTFSGAVSGTGATTMSTGTLTFQSTFAGGAFDAGTGKVVYNGTAAQAVRVGIDYYNLKLSSSVSNSIASTTMAIADSLIIDATTTITTSTTLNIGGNISGAGAFTAAGFVNLAGDWLHTGAFTPGTGTIHYNGTDQLVKNLSYYKLTMTGGTKTLEGNTTATNLVTINAATVLNMGAFTLDLQGATVNALLNSGTISGTGKVRYSGALQTVNSSTFYDLEFTGGDKTIASGNNIEVTNDWTVSANTLMTSAQNATVGRDLIHNTGALIDQGSGTIRIGRNWEANGGTFDRGTGTVIYEGGNQTIAPFTYAALVCSGTGTKTITGDIDISGTLTINSGVTFNRSIFTVTLSFNGTPLIIDGVLTGNGKFIYSGTGTQEIAATSYYDLEFSGSTKNLPADFSLEILNNWVVGAPTVFGNNAIVNLSGDISGAGTFTMNNGILNIGGTWNKTGTFTPGTGTINYNGSTQTIAVLPYHNLQVSNPGVKTLAGTTTITNVLTVNDPASLGLSSFTLNLPLAGTPFINTGTIIPGTSTVNYTAAGETNIAPGNYYNLNGTNGSRTLPSGGEVGIAGTFTPGAATYTSVAGSRVNFNGVGPQTIPAFTFNEVILSGSGSKTILTATTVTVFSIEIQDGATLDLPGTAQLNITKP